MRRSVTSLIAALAVSALSAAPAAANPFVVTTGLTAAQLVAALVGSNPGITVVGGSETYTGAATASGTFTGGSGIIPFNSGVVMTTGSAATHLASSPGEESSCLGPTCVGIEGPNVLDDASTDHGGAGDADLDPLLGVPGNTFDAAALEFDFTVAAPDISFQYAFGSEEYNEYVGSQYNDVFGFFLNGTNIALLPSTTTAVSINNVNCVTNSAYFTVNANDNGLGPGMPDCGPSENRDTQYDGLAGANLTDPTKWLFAVGTAGTGSFVNHIKLVIADANDGLFDSGVFLKAGSFQNALPEVPEPGTLLLFGTGLMIVARRLRSRSRTTA